MIPCSRRRSRQRQAGPTGSPTSDRVARARDDAIVQLENKQTAIDTLGSRVKALESRELDLTNNLETARKKAAAFEKDADETDELRKENSRLTKLNENNKQQLAELAVLADTPEGRKTLEIQQKLDYTQWAAIIGWFCSAILGVYLLYSHFLQKPLEEPVVEEPVVGVV